MAAFLVLTSTLVLLVNGDDTSNDPCAAYQYPCSTTADCCAFWEEHHAGTACQVQCSQDAAGVCHYCDWTGSSSSTSTTSTPATPTGSAAGSGSGSSSTPGCPEHEYPCQSTDDCCSYWDAHFPGTDCEAECTDDEVGGCNYCYLTGSTTTTSPTGSGSGCTHHEYPCLTTADCCNYWHVHHPGSVCEAKCTQDALSECNYCYLPSTSTSGTTTTVSVAMNPRPKTTNKRRRKRKKAANGGSGSGCPQHDYPCDSTADCCAFWETYQPGTECQAQCTEDAENGCNYCYLTSHNNTGSETGCPPHDYPCDTTADCCSYWDAHFPGTECQAECTQDQAGGCNYCYLTNSSTAIRVLGEEAELNAMNVGATTSYAWPLQFKLNLFASLCAVLVTAAVVSALFICSRNVIYRCLVHDEKETATGLLSQPQASYGSV